MRTVLFFPGNKAGVSICPVFNGHAAVVTQNTDTISEAGSALAEIGLMRNNLQGTAFIAFGTPVDLVNGMKNTGRVSLDIYFLSSQWINPINGMRQTIPDYTSSIWTAAGAAVFSGVTVGETKPWRYPNHGQDLFDVSNGRYGHDSITGKYGTNNGRELYDLADAQMRYVESTFGVKSTPAISYQNGQYQSATMLLPYFLGGRNSDYSFSGDSLVAYGSGLTRAELISRPSSTRTLDAGNTNFPSHADSIAYTCTQVQRAIDTAGWWNDFMHWHNAYNASQTWFFEDFYSAVNNQIGDQDVWRAGYGEAVEYLFLRDMVDKVGSFFEGDVLHVFIRLTDPLAGGLYQEIPVGVPSVNIEIPLSLEVNLSETPLAGKNIACPAAHSIRKLGENKWVINWNVPDLSSGYRSLQITDGGNPSDYYNSAPPTITYTGGMVRSDRPCKFVVWRSQGGAGHVPVYRSEEFESEVSITLDAAYDYTVGAITTSRVSAAIDL